MSSVRDAHINWSGDNFTFSSDQTNRIYQQLLSFSSPASSFFESFQMANTWIAFDAKTFANDFNVVQIGDADLLLPHSGYIACT